MKQENGPLPAGMDWKARPHPYGRSRRRGLATIAVAILSALPAWAEAQRRTWRPISGSFLSRSSTTRRTGWTTRSASSSLRGPQRRLALQAPAWRQSGADRRQSKQRRDDDRHEPRSPGTPGAYPEREAETISYWISQPGKPRSNATNRGPQSRRPRPPITTFAAAPLAPPEGRVRSDGRRSAGCRGSCGCAGGCRSATGDAIRLRSCDAPIVRRSMRTCGAGMALRRS